MIVGGVRRCPVADTDLALLRGASSIVESERPGTDGTNRRFSAAVQSLHGITDGHGWELPPFDIWTNRGMLRARRAVTDAGVPPSVARHTRQCDAPEEKEANSHATAEKKKTIRPGVSLAIIAVDACNRVALPQTNQAAGLPVLAPSLRRVATPLFSKGVGVLAPLSPCDGCPYR